MEERSQRLWRQWAADKLGCDVDVTFVFFDKKHISKDLPVGVDRDLSPVQEGPAFDGVSEHLCLFD